MLPDPVPCEDGLCHASERLQFQFAREWLVFADDPDAAAELATYGEAEHATGPALARHRRLNKFSKGNVVWTYGSPTLDLNVIELLAKRWPLDHRPD